MHRKQPVTRRRGARSATQHSEAIATRAFNQLLAKHPIWAAVILVVVAVGAWFFLREDAADSRTATTTSTTSVSEVATPPPETSPPVPSSASSPTGTEPTELATDPVSGLPFIAESVLPEKAKEILEVIYAGGPYEFSQDDTVFGNYEGLLPQQPHGYYREYTVQMPWDSTRGAHRFVTGADGEIYWTDDHYESFNVVKEGE